MEYTLTHLLLAEHLLSVEGLMEDFMCRLIEVQ